MPKLVVINFMDIYCLNSTVFHCTRIGPIKPVTTSSACAPKRIPGHSNWNAETYHVCTAMPTMPCVSLIRAVPNFLRSVDPLVNLMDMPTHHNKEYQ